MKMTDAIATTIEALIEQKQKAIALSKLRSMLLQCVDQINQVLGEKKKHRKPSTVRSQASAERSKLAAASTEGSRRTTTSRSSAKLHGGSTKSRRTKTRAQPTTLDELPNGAVKIPGLNGNYYFVKKLGMVSTARPNVRLMPGSMSPGGMPEWGVVTKEGKSTKISANQIALRLNLSRKALGF